MAKAKSKTIRSKFGKIRKLSNGRFQIDSVDSFGKRTRPNFTTLEEAERRLSAITVRKSTGDFRAAEGNRTFGEALDLLIERNKRELTNQGSREYVESIINAHLRPRFGAIKLSEFSADGLQSMQDWMQYLRDHDNKAQGTLQGIRSVISMTFKQAVSKRWLARNPVVEFELRVPRAKKKERDPLTLDEVTRMVGSVLQRTKQDRSELTWLVRCVLMFLGLLAGLRNEECAGLCWDCVDLSGRTLYVRRVYRAGEGIVRDTKTGKSGMRAIPMSPILVAVLEAYRARLQAMGKPVEGEVPVLVGKGGIVTPDSISQQHWDTIAKKAGFVFPDDTRLHTFYSLRHTATNLWLSIGIHTTRLMKLTGHSDYKTTVENYIHETPSFAGLARQVKQLGGEDTNESLVERLGIVLAQRWREAGIGVACAPPAESVPMIGGPSSGSLLIEGTVIDQEPSRVSFGAPQSTIIVEEDSIEALRQRQIAQTKALFADGWSKTRIAAKLKVDPSTVSMWIREMDIPHVRGKLPDDVRLDLQQRLAELRVKHPRWGTEELARHLGVRPNRITLWERARGNPLPHTGPGAYKLGQHERRIREMVAAGKTLREMATALGGVSPTGVALFVKKLGLQTTRWGQGERIDQHDAEILRLYDEGQNAKQIAEALGTVSHSGVARRMNTLGLKARAARGQRVDQYDADIRRMVAEGKNGKQIAMELNAVHYTTICKRIKDLGLVLPSKQVMRQGQEVI